MKTEIIKCDVCKLQVNVKELKIDVLFHTDQTEGRGVPTYLSHEKVDLCDDCLKKVLGGNYIHASGAMGYNEFYFHKLHYDEVAPS